MKCNVVVTSNYWSFLYRYELADWSGSILAQCAHESVRVPSGLASRSVAPAKQAADWDSTQVGGVVLHTEVLHKISMIEITIEFVCNIGNNG